MSLSPYRQAANAFLRVALPRETDLLGLDVGGAGARSAATRPAGQRWEVCDPLAPPWASYPTTLAEAHFGTKRFDTIKATDLLYLVAEPVAELRLMRARVTPFGWLVATVPLCTEVAREHHWRGGPAAWIQACEDAGWGFVEITPLGGRWTLLLQVLDTLNLRGLRGLVRRLAPLALRLDRRWASGWALGYGITARPVKALGDPGPGLFRARLTAAAWLALGLRLP